MSPVLYRLAAPAARTRISNTCSVTEMIRAATKEPLMNIDQQRARREQEELSMDNNGVALWPASSGAENTKQSSERGGVAGAREAREVPCRIALTPPQRRHRRRHRPRSAAASTCAPFPAA